MREIAAAREPAHSRASGIQFFGKIWGPASAGTARRPNSALSPSPRGDWRNRSVLTTFRMRRWWRGQRFHERHSPKKARRRAPITIRGAREHNLKNVDVDHPARPAGGVHRPVRLGQILARLRHHLCRGPAPLRREPVGLRAAIPRDDAEAGRRPDRRPVARHLDRAEDHLEEPALDRRHRHRDLRLHAPAVGARRRALLAGHRSADRKPDRVADGRPRAGAAGRHAHLSCWRRSCAAARANTKRNWPSSCARATSASRSTARSTRSATSSRSTRNSPTTSTSWSTAWW